MSTVIKQILNLVPSALVLVFAFYGCYHFISEIITSFIPFGIFLTTTLVIAFYVLKVPQPPQEAVEAIIGKDLLDDGNHQGYVLKMIAHRGAALDAPENSLAAFDMCHIAGCDFIEFDVSLTSDGIPIVFHDPTLERMTDSNLIVKDTTYEVLKSIDISVKHPLRDRFGTTNIPTLDETITKLLANGQRMIIDIKDNNSKVIPVILDLFVRYPILYSNAIVSSFFPNILYRIRRSDPKIVCSMAYRPYRFASEYFKYPEGEGPPREHHFWKHYFLVLMDSLHSWALPRVTYYLIGLSVILLHKHCLSALEKPMEIEDILSDDPIPSTSARESVLQWRSKGVRVMAWTVNSPTEKQHLVRNLKVTYLTDTLTGEASVHSCGS